MAGRSLKIIAAAALGTLIVASSAAAADFPNFDDNGNDYGGGYSRDSLNRYCYENPYDERCDPYLNRRPRPTYKKKAAKSYHDNCAAKIRAVGKRNIVKAFARNSALFAWRREARAVHGQQYANWHRARNAEIVCDRVTGLLTSCIAVAKPCR